MRRAVQLGQDKCLSHLSIIMATICCPDTYRSQDWHQKISIKAVLLHIGRACEGLCLSC